jgi:hypothetical protein
VVEHHLSLHDRVQHHLSSHDRQIICYLRELLGEAVLSLARICHGAETKTPFAGEVGGADQDACARDREKVGSEWQDLNLRPPRPERERERERERGVRVGPGSFPSDFPTPKMGKKIWNYFIYISYLGM